MNLQWILWVYDIFTFPIGIPRRVISLLLAFLEQVMDPPGAIKNQPHGFQQAEFDGYEDEAMETYDAEYDQFPIHSEPVGVEQRFSRAPSPAPSNCSQCSHCSRRSHASARRVTPAEMQQRIRSMEEEEQKLKDLRASMQEQLDLETRRSFTPIQGPIPSTPTVVQQPVKKVPTPVEECKTSAPPTQPTRRSIVDFENTSAPVEPTPNLEMDVVSEAESFVSALSSASDVSKIAGRRRNNKKKKKKKKKRR